MVANFKQIRKSAPDCLRCRTLSLLCVAKPHKSILGLQVLQSMCQRYLMLSV
jgi:hypothetical protein